MSILEGVRVSITPELGYMRLKTEIGIRASPRLNSARSDADRQPRSALTRAGLELW